MKRMAKNELVLKNGAEVYYQNKPYFIKAILSLEKVLLVDIESQAVEAVDISDLHPQASVEIPELLLGYELQGVSEKDWNKAIKRLEVIQPLINMIGRTKRDVDQRAKQFNLNVSVVYKWIKIYESEGRLLTALMTRGRSDKGNLRLNEVIEAIIDKAIADYYLTEQRKSVKFICKEIGRVCFNAGLKSPHENTIRNRIASLPENLVISKRYGAKEAENHFAPSLKSFPDADYPLAVWQIDHTKLDIILVDEIYRRPIGRPWITIAIDVNTRMTVGFYISFDPPSALSVGLCLSQAILPKDRFVEEFNLKQKWPIWGIPKKVHADNAKEFRGGMLIRACQQYNIDLEWRPVKKPRFGGHIERLQGTLLAEIHDLAGTTFSNIQKRANYDSEKHADKTLEDLEKWLTILIVDNYHIRKHSQLGMSPLKKYKDGILGSDSIKGIGLPDRVVDETKLKLDFLPFTKRTVQDYGIVIDDIFYYHDVLRRWINSKEPDDPTHTRKFIVRVDPRDISQIWFYDPELKTYYPIPYRNTSHPRMSVWDLREAKKKAKLDGLDERSEKDIFDSLNRLRQIETDAYEKTKAARKAQQKRNIGFKKAKDHIKSPVADSLEPLSSYSEASRPLDILPFEELDDEY